MAAVVRIDFRAAGVADVRQAIEGVAKASQRAAQEQVRATERAARDQDRVQREMDRASRARFLERVREQDRVQKETDRAAQARFRERVRDQARAEQNAARERVKVAREAAREQDRVQREMDRADRARFRERVREREREQRGAQVREMAAARATVTSRMGLAAGAGRGLRSGLGTLQGVAMLGAGAIGASTITGAVQTQARLQLGSAQLAADVRQGSGEFLDPNKIVSDAQRVARATGIAAEDVLAAMSRASGEGGGAKGLEAFRGALDKVGTIALASGTSMEDLASISATMTNNQITSSEEQIRLMLSINAAAKEGNVNFREMASNVQEVAGMIGAMQFKGSAQDKMLGASGLIQIARMGGAASAAEASTSAKSFLADLGGAKANRLTGGSIYTKDEKGNRILKSPVDAAVEIFRKTKGDAKQLSEVFDLRSKPTQAAFTDAFLGKNKGLTDASGKTLSGEAGIRALFASMANKSQSEQQIGQEADLILQQGATKFARAMEDFRAKVGSDLLPTITQLIPQFTKLSQGIAQAIEFIAREPVKAVGLFLALKAGLGAAEFAVSAFATRVLASTARIPGPGGTPTLPGGGPVKGSPAEAVGAVLAGASAGVAVGTLIASDVENNRKAEAATTDKMAFNAVNQTTRLRSGKFSPIDLENAKANVAKMEEQRSGVGRFISGATKGVSGLLKGDFTAENFAGLIQPVVAARALGSAVFGGQETADGSNFDASLQGLKEAITTASQKEQPIAGTVSIGNIQELAAAIGKGRDPASEPITGGNR